MTDEKRIYTREYTDHVVENLNSPDVYIMRDYFGRTMNNYHFYKNGKECFPSNIPQQIKYHFAAILKNVFQNAPDPSKHVERILSDYKHKFTNEAFRHNKGDNK